MKPTIKATLYTASKGRNSGLSSHGLLIFMKEKSQNGILFNLESYFFPLLCLQVETEKYIVPFKVSWAIRNQTFNIVTEVHVSVVMRCFC